MDSGPVDVLSVGGDVALPFACRLEDGGGRPEEVVKARAIQCALSRVCGICGLPLGRPVALVGSAGEADEGAFAFPPCHATCAHERAVDAARRSGDAEPSRVVVTTGGFDLVRPARRGDPVSFRPNSTLGRIDVD